MRIVITGGTRGIGFALTERFISLENTVVISGTRKESVDNALNKLDSNTVYGTECRVEFYEEVAALYDYAKDKMGGVDIWINNAGINQPGKNFCELDSTEYEKVIDVDLIGLMNGTRIAIENMLKQGSGFIYNMEGLGSDGRIIPGSIVYGTAKRAVRYFTRAMAKEAEGTCVSVCRISPGMVLTDFLLRDLDENTPENLRTKKVFNILADEPHTVTDFLVDKILANKKNNAYFAWLTTPKIIFRFMTPWLRKNKFFKTG